MRVIARFAIAPPFFCAVDLLNRNFLSLLACGSSRLFFFFSFAPVAP